MNRRIHAFVSGKVQGVWYRASTQQIALELGLTGWVRNLTDGRVEIIAEGNEDKLNELVDWCWKGPELAAVTDIETRQLEFQGEFESFDKRDTV